MKPIIGVSANRFAADPQRPVFKNMELHYAEAHLLEAIYKAGGLPFIIPSFQDASRLFELVANVAGIVLAGGADVSPESYGRKEFDSRWPGDRARDVYEMNLVKQAEKSAKPIFGVCRGLQLLNVAYGGTLYQDINTEKPGTFIHRDWDIYEQNVHEVSLAPNTWISKLYKKPKLKVNTVHHQAIRELSPMLEACATSSDGLVEAIVHKQKPEIRGVQWHPEWQPLDRQGVDDLELVIRDFIETCRGSK